MKGLLRGQWSAIWFWGIVAVCGALVVVTLFQTEVRESGGIAHLLSRFILTTESNFGAWWSGLLLFVVALHAFDGYMLFREDQPHAARGWLLLSIILLILSADEISSLHERTNAFFQLDSLLALLPFGLILLIMLAYAITSLWSSKEHRAQVWAIASGFFLFGAVVLMEVIEKRVDWGRIGNLRGTIEEAIELLGMLVLLTVAMRNTRGIFSQDGAGAYPTFELVRPISLSGLVIGLVLASVIGYVTALRPDLEQGNPADWFSAMVFLMAGLAAASSFFKFGENIGILNWAMTGICLVASAGFVAVSPQASINVVSMDLNPRELLFLAVSALTCAIWALSSQREPRIDIPAIIAIGFLALVLVLEPSLLSLFVLPTYLGLLVYYVNSNHMRCRKADHQGDQEFTFPRNLNGSPWAHPVILRGKRKN